MQFSSSGHSRRRVVSAESRDRHFESQQEPKRSRSRSGAQSDRQKTSQRSSAKNTLHASTINDQSPSSERKQRTRKKKEFAWMDSEDDGSGDESSGGSSGSREIPPPSSASEVQTLSQMMRMAPMLKRSARDLLMTELSAVCQAASRVKFYDAGIFEAVVAAVRKHLRSPGPLNPDEVVDVVTGLADVNAYDKDLFEAALQAMEKTPGKLTQLAQPLRKRVLDAYAKVNHGKNLPFLKHLMQLERDSRYQAACEEVIAEWQKPGAIVVGGVSAMSPESGRHSGSGRVMHNSIL